MRLTALEIENFRCYRNRIRVDFDDLTLLVGRNDVGKSAIFDALAVFFDEISLDGEDRTVGSDENLIKIRCYFSDLPSSLILDSDRPTTLEDEHLLNRDGQLVIERHFSGNIQKPKEVKTYAVCDHPTAEGCSDLTQLTNSNLKTRAQNLGVELTGVDQTANPELREAIRAHVGTPETEESEIELNKDGTVKIWRRLSGYLPLFALFKSDRPSTDQDSEAQDPLKEAIKEALRQRQDELDTLADFVEQQVRVVAENTVSKLKEIDPDLASELRPIFSKPNWPGIFKVSLTDDEAVPINKRGSGVRRLILLNFFRAKAEQSSEDESRSGVILAIEEPETSQHPHNQKLLLKSFLEISDRSGHQVFLSTHTPVLARLLPDNALRYVKKEDDGSRSVMPPGEQTYQTITSELGVLPDHDVKVFVGAEGITDITALKNLSITLSQTEADIHNLDTAEKDGHLIFIPLGGSNLTLWVDRLRHLNRPELHLFDRDTEPPEDPTYAIQAQEINERDNAQAFITSKLELENYIHYEAINQVYDGINLEQNFSDFTDVPTEIAHLCHDLSETTTLWDDLNDEKRKSKVSRVKQRLAREASVLMTPDQLSEIDPSHDIRTFLREIATQLKINSA